ncbi:MAG: hypothetical protein ABII22_03940 [Candidatus Micrarchaeota archaeon]
MRILLALAVVVFFLFGCLGPALSLEKLKNEDRAGMENGCYQRISGSVRNAGSSSAEMVLVNCTAVQGESKIGSRISTLPIVAAGSSSEFSVDVPTDCFRGKATYSCEVECRNC